MPGFDPIIITKLLEVNFFFLLYMLISIPHTVKNINCYARAVDVSQVFAVCKEIYLTKL